MKFEKNINKNIEDEINNICITNKKTKLVLCGGGMKGLYLIGGLKYLSELDILKNITTYAGTSIGGLICFMLSIDYSIDELYKCLKTFNFENTIDENFDLNSIFKDYSINSHQNIDFIVEKIMNYKNINKNITLIQLYNKTKKKIILTSVNIYDKICEYISYETYPDLEILTALKMTMAVPLLFPPIKLNNKLYIDGGILNNFPIDIFNDNLDEVIGINLQSEFLYVKNYDNIINYILRIMSIFFQPNIKKFTDENYKNIVYNIKIDNDVKTFNFELTSEKKKEMYLNGYNLFKNEYDKN